VLLRAFLPIADKLAHLPGCLRGRYRGVFASSVEALLIDIVERERETQAACESSGSWGNLGPDETNGRLCLLRE